MHDKSGRQVTLLDMSNMHRCMVSRPSGWTKFGCGMSKGLDCKQTFTICSVAVAACKPGPGLPHVAPSPAHPECRGSSTGLSPHLHIVFVQGEKVNFEIKVRGAAFLAIVGSLDHEVHTNSCWDPHRPVPSVPSIGAPNTASRPSPMAETARHRRSPHLPRTGCC